jgi:hypothetical protein
MSKYKGVMPTSETKKKSYQSIYSHSKYVKGRHIDYYEVVDMEDNKFPRVPMNKSVIREISKWNFLL